MSLISPLQFGGLATQIGGRLLGGVSNLMNRITSSGQSNKEDSSEISPAAQMLSRSLSPSLFNGLAGVQPRADGSVHLEDIVSFTQADLAAFRAAVGKIFSANGIDLGEGVELSVDANDKVVATGEGADNAEIERIFAENPELAEQFRRLSANLGLIQAAGEAKDFQQMYRTDPQGAVDRYAYLFDENRDRGVTFRLSQSGIETLIDGEPYCLEG